MLLILLSLSGCEDPLSLRLAAVHENSLDSDPRLCGDKLRGSDAQTKALQLLRLRVPNDRCLVPGKTDPSASEAEQNPRGANGGRALTRDRFEIEDLVESLIERLEESRVGAGNLRTQRYERSQEVIENKGDRFITNCNSQEVSENKWVIFCKAKRLLIGMALATNERIDYGHYAQRH